MNANRTCALLLALLLPVLGGCMNSVRLNERGVVEAIALDRDERGGYRAVLQLWTPSGKQGDTPGTGAPALLDVDGRTLTELFDEAALARGKQPFLGSCRLILLGERAARMGVGEIADFFNANPQLSPTVTLAVTRGEAGALLSAQQQSPGLDADRLLDMIRRGQENGRAPKSRLMDLVGAMNSPGRSASLALAELAQPPPEPQGEMAGEASESASAQSASTEAERIPKLELIGSAAFLDGRMALVLDPAETRGVAWAAGEIRRASVTVDDPMLGKIAAITSRQRTKIDIEQVGDTLVFEITVRVYADTLEVAPGEGGTLDEEQTTYAEALLAREIRREIERAIQTAQSRGYDLLLLSQRLRQRAPDYLAAYQNDLSEAFAACGYRVDVSCQLDRSGVRGGLL